MYPYSFTEAPDVSLLFYRSARCIPTLLQKHQMYPYSFTEAPDVSLLFYRSTRCIPTLLQKRHIKHNEKKLDGNNTRILSAILNESNE